MNEFVINFPGGARVDAHFGPYTVKTDQPPSGGGQGSAPAPFSLFLASIGTCAGIYGARLLNVAPTLCSSGGPPWF